MVAVVVVLIGLVLLRRRQAKYGFQVRPIWATVAIGIIATIAILGAVWVVNAYPWPEQLAIQYAEANGIEIPPGGLVIPTGIAFPVLIMIGVAILMTHLAERRRFGRNVYAIGGNPQAAELSGINTKRTVTLVFAVMGLLAGVSAVVQTARLNAAVTGLGVTNELDVISAAVIGGTSFSGGIGTIPGAVLGAVVMQSLRSGMVLLDVDSPTQDIIVGIVLVAAVGFDAFLRRRTT
jgi:D-xylose transport system permease protein